MQPLAVDCPTPPEEYCAYGPSGNGFGNDLYNLQTVPPGCYLEVVTQPTHGTVHFSGGGTSWNYDMTDPPAMNTLDTFTFRVSNGTDHSAPATCTVSLLVET